MTTLSRADITPLELATFTFAPDEPNAGEQGVVMAYVVRLADGVLLFDTGFGFGSREVEERYHPLARRISDALAAVGVAVADVRAVVNCHLHIDHAGQNLAFPGVPIHVQVAEWRVAHATEHTILEWIDFESADYRRHAGDYTVLPGIEALVTPGHTPGHQSLVVRTAGGPIVLVGQAAYSVGEWNGEHGAREGRSRAWDRDAYDASLVRLRALNPIRAYFGHDREAWSAQES